MAPTYFLAVSAFAFLALRFLLLPLLQRYLTRSGAPLGLGAIGALGALESAVSLALLLTVSAGAVVLALLGLDYWFQHAKPSIGIERLLSVIDAVRAVQAAAHNIHLGTLAALVVGLAGGAIYLAWRGRRSQVAAIVEKERAAQMEALTQQLKNGTLPELPPTEQMKRVLDEIGRLDVLEAQFTAQAGMAPGQSGAIIESVRRRRDELVRWLTYLDLERRVKPDMGAIVHAPRKGGWPAVGNMLVSPGLLDSLGRLAKAGFVAAALLYVPASVALVGSSAGAQARLAASLDELEGFSIELARKRANELFARQANASETERASAPPAEPGAPKVDMAARDWCTEATAECDNLVLTRLSMAYEQAFARFVVRRIGPDAGGPSGGPSGGPPDAPSDGPQRKSRVGETRATAFHAVARQASRRKPADFIDPMSAIRMSGPDAPAPGDRPRPPGAGSGDPIATVAIEDRVDGLDPEHRTPIREAFQRFLSEELISRRPNAWQALRARLAGQAAFFRELPTRASLQQALALRAVSLGLAAATAGNLDVAFDRVMTQPLAGYHEASFAVLSRAYMTELLATADPDRASMALERAEAVTPALRSLEVAELQRVAPRIVRSATEAERQIEERPVALSRLADAIDASRVEEVLSRIGETLNIGSDKRKKASRLGISGYPDIFPPTAPPSGTPGPRPSGPGPQGRPGGASAAHVFARMHANPYVGGVVFGRPPQDAGTTIDIRDIAWRTEGKWVKLFFSTADGTRIELGPYDGQIVHLALAYVADGRVVSATVLNTSLHDQRASLHPALLDTALGCRMLAVDFYVFDLTEADREVGAAQRQIGRMGQIYRMAWSARADGLLTAVKAAGAGKAPWWIDAEDLAKRLEESVENYLKAHVGRIERGLVNDETLQKWLNELDVPLAMSFLEAKSEFFDSGLTGTLEQCLGASRQLADVRACLGRSAMRTLEEARRPRLSNDDMILRLKREGQWRQIDLVSALLAHNDVAPGKLLAALTPVPQFNLVSAVRERPWTLDPELSFAKPRASGEGNGTVMQPPLGAASEIDFSIQVVFTSPPHFRSGLESWWDRAAHKPTPKLDAAFDLAPWQFPSIADRVRSAVATVKDVRRDEYEPVETFVRMQKLFRAALDGRLGARFPLHKLAALARDTAVGVTEMATPRWKSRPGYLELDYIRWLHKTGGDLPDSDPHAARVRQLASSCQAAAGLGEADLKQTEVDEDLQQRIRILARLPQSTWTAACVLAKDDVPSKDDTGSIKTLQVVAAQGQRFAALREVRSVAGVHAYDDKPHLGPKGKAVCAPM